MSSILLSSFSKFYREKLYFYYHEPFAIQYAVQLPFQVELNRSHNRGMLEVG